MLVDEYPLILSSSLKARDLVYQQAESRSPPMDLTKPGGDVWVIIL